MIDANFGKNYTSCNSVSSAGRVYIGKHQAAADVVHVLADFSLAMETMAHYVTMIYRLMVKCHRIP